MVVKRLFIICYLPSPEMEIFAFCVITFEPIKIWTQLAPQNDRLNLSFVKDKNIGGEKMTRNGRKTAIRAGGSGRLLLDGDPLIYSTVVSLDNFGAPEVSNAPSLSPFSFNVKKIFLKDLHF